MKSVVNVTVDRHCFVDPELDRVQKGTKEVWEDSEGELANAKRQTAIVSDAAYGLQIRCIDLYMDEKVAKRSFADHRVVDALLKVVEDEYTNSFGERRC